MPLQIRRGTEAERQAMTVPLAVGEPLFVTDTGSIYVGNGTSPGGVQVTGLTIEDSVDAVAAALVAGINQNITFVYGTAQDQANRIDCRLDLSTVEGTIDADGFKGPLLADDSGVIVNTTNRNITANEISATDISANNLTISGTVISSAVISDFKGSVFGDDSSILVNALDSSINLSGTIKANVVPAFNDVIDIGSVGTRFRSLYLSNTGLFIDDARIQSTFFGAIELPEGSTVGGQPISVIGNLTGDINANIIGDDSGVIVNVATRDIIATSITGNLTGDVTGSVFSNDSTIMVNGLTREITGGLITGTTISTEVLDIQGLEIYNDGPDLYIFSNPATPTELNFNVNSGGTSFRAETTGSFDNSMYLFLDAFRNTHTTPALVQNNDTLGAIIFRGYTARPGTGFANAFSIFCNVADTSISSGDSSLDTRLIIAGSSTDISNDLVTKFDLGGKVTTPIFKAQPFADVTARNSAIPAAEAGMIVFLLDDGSSGGSPVVPKLQVYDGSSWINLN